MKLSSFSRSWRRRKAGTPAATPMDEPIDLLNFSRPELEAELRSALGVEPFRARQLVQWIYRKRVREFSAMTDIAQNVRTALAARYVISRPEAAEVRHSSDGTKKFLFALADGSKVESVLIRQPTRYTLCISSQVGCAMGCRFCRTGEMGFTRHLTTSEIIGQVLAVQDFVAASDNPEPLEGPAEAFSNIVFMGMGEPLHNIDNVLRAVWLLNDELGLNFSQRKVTVSTSGLVPAIRRLGESGAPANLAVSLNATTDEVRSALLPVNRRYPLKVLLDALRAYPLKPRQRITIEYVLLSGVNDSDDDMARLPRLLQGIPVKVNLIPYNANTGLPFSPPARDRIAAWQDYLLSRGVNATIRWSKGDDISAACGQLATDARRKRREHVTPI